MPKTLTKNKNAKSFFCGEKNNISYHKKLIARLFLSIFFVFLFPVFANAQYCVSTAGVTITTMNEAQCRANSGHWTTNSSSGSVNCNFQGKVYESISFRECKEMRGNTVENVNTAVVDPKAANIKASNPDANKSTDGFIPYFKGTSKDSSIGQYIQAIYNYAIGIVGIVAVVVIMIGGLIWITSLGNAGRVTSAKDWIGGALTGLALAMFSWSLLYIINPDLVYFKPINPKTIGAAPEITTLDPSCTPNTKSCDKLKCCEGLSCNEQKFCVPKALADTGRNGCCEYQGIAKTLSETDCKNLSGQFFLGKFPNRDGTSCAGEALGCCAMACDQSNVKNCEVCTNQKKSDCSGSYFTSLCASAPVNCKHYGTAGALN